jgi:uncharacterized SAM-binding protein YcdF (DUF218 family)
LQQFRAKWLKRSLLACCLILLVWLGAVTWQVQRSAAAPLSAVLVLGGSIQREIYVAELVKQQPQVPVLISQGVPEPCVWSIFARTAAPMQNVWLEKCADSTFGNFYYSLPILQQWRVRRIKLLTSKTHLPRAQWLAQILLGAHGIWVETEIVPEKGIPGNRESMLKTGLDVARSLGWAVVSQFYAPKCAAIVPLSQVNMATWQQRGFHCEQQGRVKKVS